MPEAHRMPTPQRGNHKQPLATGQDSMAIVNLRGDARDPAFVQAVQQALGLALPVKACSTLASASLRIVWAGPDDWFVIGQAGQQAHIMARLQSALAGQHYAVTDVSSGYFQVSLAGIQARDVLLQGCPLDLHPRSFQPGQAAGSHFFKVGIYLWMHDDASTFQLLVRRSFIDHFWQLISHCTLDCGWAARQAA